MLFFHGQAPVAAVQMGSMVGAMCLGGGLRVLVAEQWVHMCFLLLLAVLPSCELSLVQVWQSLPQDPRGLLLQPSSCLVVLPVPPYLFFVLSYRKRESLGPGSFDSVNIACGPISRTLCACDPWRLPLLFLLLSLLLLLLLLLLLCLLARYLENPL